MEKESQHRRDWFHLGPKSSINVTLKTENVTTITQRKEMPPHFQISPYFWDLTQTEVVWICIPALQCKVCFLHAPIAPELLRKDKAKIAQEKKRTSNRKQRTISLLVQSWINPHLSVILDLWNTTTPASWTALGDKTFLFAHRNISQKTRYCSNALLRAECLHWVEDIRPLVTAWYL